MPGKMSKKRMHAFFVELFERCQQKHIYSVIETAQKMGVDYDLVKQWASTNELWSDMLELSRDFCAGHAEHDGLIFIIPAKTAFRYMLECDDEFLAMYPTPKEQARILGRQRRNI